MNLVTKENLGGEIIPRSVLLCSFEGVCSVIKAFRFLNVVFSTHRPLHADYLQ